MVYKVCAYTFWSVLEINTGFRRSSFEETSEEYGFLMREHLFSSSMVSSPGFSFLGPSRPDLVIHRLDGVDLEFGVDMWFLWDVWLAGC